MTNATDEYFHKKKHFWSLASGCKQKVDVCTTCDDLTDDTCMLPRYLALQDLSQGGTLCMCVALNLHFHNAQILLMLFLVGVWWVQWESLGEANKQPPSPPPPLHPPSPTPHPHVTARRSQVPPKIGRFVGTGGKNARKFTAKIVHKLGSCRGLWRSPPVRVFFCRERHLLYFHLTIFFGQTTRNVDAL